MFRKRTPAFLFICILAVFISCSAIQKQEIKEVEELSIKVKLLQTTFDGIDIEKVRLAKDNYKKNMENVANYYHTDTIQFEVAHTLNQYKAIKKTEKNLNENFKINKKNIGLLIDQLNKLKVDIENNAIQSDSIQSFIDFETQNVLKLSDDIGTFVTNCEYIIEIHDAYAEEVRGLTVAFK